jgi:type I restriction enzyme S subunit
MSFPAYPAYRDSGVPWLGRVPAGWTVLPFKRVARIVTERAADRSFAVGLEHVETWSGRLIEAEAEFEGEGIAFRAGDILFGKLRPYLAKAWLADRPGEAVGDFHVIRVQAPHRPEFFQRLLLSREVILLIDGSTYGAKMPRASWEFIGSLPIPLPPPAEQRAIAAFLDRECGKIDALVAEQERLIALLKEKRQAVISHAVTKGLDPSAPMKDSGVPWLGRVPEHWEVHRLSRRCGFTSGKAHEPFIDEDGSFICVTARFVSTQGAEQRRCTENLTPAGRGDILMVMSDLPKGRALAKAFLVRDNEAYAVNQRVCAVTPRADDPAFLAYQLDRSPWLLANDDGVNQTHLSNQDFLKLPLLVPPRDEQELIATFLDRATSAFDTLITEAERAIALLKERRAALISAAVTGQIDVRGLVPTEEAQAA